MKNKNNVPKNVIILSIIAGIFAIYATPCFAGLESSLVDMKMKLTGVILPVIAVMGLGIAAISLFSGNPNAKQHIVYAIAGCIFAFGAQAIVDFIAQTIR